MHVLQISAAPSAHALTSELAATAQSTVRELGHCVTTLDLMSLGWDPVVRASDYGARRFTGPVGTYATAAARDGVLGDQIREHQRLLVDADLIILTFPLWWGGMPAILKGWVDRVFTQGFAYGLHDENGNPRKYGDGALAGRRGLIITTAGDRPSSFSDRGINGDIDALLFPITHGIFWYTGIEPLRPLALLGIDSPVWAGADDARARVRNRMRGIGTEEPIPYRRMLEDYDGERRLRPGISAGRTDLGMHVRSEQPDDLPVRVDVDALGRG
jgi:NAD(P)H dehydrogenase (quinone)